MTAVSPDAEAAAEHLDVLIVGAGLSGIDAAYRLQTRNPAHRYAILEARDAIGGTWDLFRYPGIRSDSDMTTLGFPFRPWRGEKAIVEGDAIRAYIEDTARAFGIDRHIRFGHRVLAANWSSADARWTVRCERGGDVHVLSCNFLFFCSGYYDYAEGHAPVWPGMDAFKGRIVHPQFWPDALDVAGKRIAVIGSGATAVTLIPALVAAGAAAVTMVQRSPTYIVSRPAKDAIGGKLRRWLPASLADPAIRWKNILLSTYLYQKARRDPERMKQLIASGQRAALGPDFDMRHLTPRYDPWDQRICVVPDGDMFAAIRAGKADIVTDTIDRFDAEGLRFTSGATLPSDIIVSATGLKVRLMGGATLDVDGVRVEVGERLLYRGAMLEGVPNFAFATGYTNASWTLKCDLTAQYVSRLLAYMDRRGIAVACPRAAPDARSDAPMLDIKAGYVERAAALLPRQGRAAPWRVHQSYARDLLAFRASRISDGALQFTKRT